MNPSKRLHLTVAALCMAAVPAIAQTTAVSPPAGFVSLPLLANSDTRISTPLTRPPVFTGAVTTPLPGAGSTVTVSGSPGWAANQFGPAGGIPTHYAIFGPAAAAYAAEGKFFSISGNGANTLVLDLSGDDISSVPANAQVQVIPFWTLGTLFPASDAGVSFIASASQFARQTEILLPNSAAPGTDTAVAATYYFTAGSWKKFGDGTVNHDNDILWPAESFTVRNKATGTTLVNLGGVELKKVTAPLATQAVGKQDNFVAIVRPVDVALKDLGLTTNNAFVTSPSQFARTDELLVFDNTAVGTDKSASATYYRLAGAVNPDTGWRKFGAPATDAGNDIIPAGAGFVVRKAAAAGGATAFWTNDKTYNP
jgi:uncharacterized protein (TIGR02597 family)